MNPSKETIYFEPENGWFSFSDSDHLLDAIWQDLTEETGEWKYTNPTSNMSIWENQHDGSYIFIYVELNPDQKIIELYATAGVATQHLIRTLEPFHLRITNEKLVDRTAY